MAKLRFSLLVTGLLLLGGCPAPQARPLDQPVSVSATGPYLHSETGMRFPENVGEFVRRSVLRFDQNALHVSASYDCLEGGGRRIFLTTFVYPAPQGFYALGEPSAVRAMLDQFLVNEFESAKQDLVKAHPVRLVHEEITELTQNGKTVRGLKATYAETGAPNTWEQLYMFLYHEHWFIEYRVTANGYDSSSLDAKVGKFMRDLTWPGA